MKSTAPTVDVLIAAVAWTRALPSVEAHCRKVARAAFRAAASRAAKRSEAITELSLVLTSDTAIRKLNAAYRRKDKATNVLSFPSDGIEDVGGRGALILGDVVIAYGTVAREAREAHKSLKDHLSHMVVHGVLHLLGYDHESAPDAQTMERLETKILSQIGAHDPYAEPGARPTSRGARRRT